jgi:hypothetical protein
MLCLPILTEVVVEKKVIELKKRIQYISICAAVISCLGSVSTRAFYINLASSEVRHYVKVFGLDQRHTENIEDLQYDFSVVSVDDFIVRKLNASRALVPVTLSGHGIIELVSNIVQVANETKTFLDGFLFNILSELRKDAITVHMHYLKKATR